MRPALALMVGLAAMLSGCAVGPDYKPPAPPAASPGFVEGATPGFSTDPPQVAWWKTLQDPVLDDLVGRATKANDDLRIALANVEAAQATYEAVASVELPQVDANLSYSRSRSSAATILNQPHTILPNANLTAGTLNLSWELDLFGRLRRTVEAARADAEQEEALRQDVLVVVLADLASAYVDLRGSQLRLSVAQRNADTQNDTFALTETLSSAGRASDLDIARARTQLETTLATIPPLEAAINADEHRIAVLVGLEPNALNALLGPSRPLPQIPALVTIGDPPALLRRRPDVRATERALAATTARIGVATADLYPRITLIGALGSEANQPSALTAGGAVTYGIGPSLSWTLFDRQAIYARIRAANANTDAALANFEKTVLTALQETETALNQYARERNRRDTLAAAAEASARATELAQTRYRFGVENFLTVLDAERTQLGAEDQLAQSEVLVAQDLVTIYRALGGGWETEAKPGPL